MHDVVLSSCGDPYDPGTWSGTPRNVIQALERRGLSVRGVDSTLSSRHFAIPTPGRLIPFAGRVRRALEDQRTAKPRTRSATYVAEQARLLACTNILHVGTLDLPLPRRDPQQRHFMLCDTTWDLWARQATDMSRYSGSYIREADELERAAYHQVEHIFPLGRYVTKNLVEHYAVEPTRITPVGSGLNRIKPYYGEKDYRHGHLLAVAKARFEDKGGRLLLEAFQLAQRVRPALKLIIVGSSANAEYVRGTPNVTVTGHVPDRELQRLFEEASLFAMPALNEPWGLVFLEALACKTPILGLARNALPEMTGSGRYGFLVDQASPDAVAAALLRALADPERLRQMGMDGQKHCLETYTWDTLAERIATRILE